jgi:aminopeptidase-like protein
MDGTRLVDFSKNPLHLWSHSISFHGEIMREDLENHLYYDSKRPDWIPYHYQNGFKYDAQDWGFCLSFNDYKTLVDEKYLVHIDAELKRNGSMKVIDHFLPGKNRETIFFAAHTCHPGQVTDGLSNIAVLIEFFRYLKSLDDRRYSYRLILGPEYFAAAGFLAMASAEEIELMRGGIYLDMLGNNHPIGYQTSYQGDSFLDKVLETIFNTYAPHHVKASFRKIAGNDEIFYNGPGFNIPTSGIAGATHPECHSDRDNLDFVNLYQLLQSHDLLIKTIQVLETDYIPLPNFKGPIYLSRYKLYIDPQLDRSGYDRLQDIQFLMNGYNSCFDIAYSLGIDYFFVKKFCDELIRNGLIKRGSYDLSQKRDAAANK